MRSLRVASIAVGSSVLCAVLFSACGALRKEPTRKCPAPLVYGTGHFYQLDKMNPAFNRVLFQLVGSYEGALNHDEKRGLVSVELFGAPGRHGADELIAEPAKYRLGNASTVWNWWYFDEPVNDTTDNRWVVDQPYTVAVRQNYKTKNDAHVELGHCLASKAIVFKAITKAMISPIAKAGDVGPHPPGSEGANASVSGLFFGAQGYALYTESYVDADDTSSSNAMITTVECYSSSSQTNLFDAGNLFKTKTFNPPVDRWNITSLRDSNYDGSETWYVGFKLTYAASTTVPTNQQTTKVFTGLDSAHQGTAVPGE